MDPHLRVEGERVQLFQGKDPLGTTSVEEAVEALAANRDVTPSCGVLPRGVRLVRERGDATALVVEVPPQLRTVRWLDDDSPQPFGPKARYRERFLAFPYLVLLVVFRRGALTGAQQLYYRNEPLDAGEELLLPNLYNVAEGYGLRCWLCLAALSGLSPLAWPAKVDRIIEHVFWASFNQSSEVNEGNSYWGRMQGIDPRVASLDAWEEASRADRRFPLSVAWQPAGTTASAELERMLDAVVQARPLRSAADLAALLATRPGRRERC
jgi:hypothetical protein